MIAVETAPDTLGEGRLHEILDRNPYGMVAGALAVGFVLGGGLFTRLTARIAGAGLRIGLAAAWPLLQQQLFAKKGRVTE